jgi:hypothetical protein
MSMPGRHPLKERWYYHDYPSFNYIVMTQKYRCGIVHFNDVYHVSPGKSEPVGGAARFTTAIRDSRQHLESQGYADPLVLFSGDVFSPSTESSITRGKHMYVNCLWTPIMYPCSLIA